MSLMKLLEKHVAETAAVVVDWRGKIAQIETQISIAQHTLANAEKHRQEHALNASFGDAVAVSEIKREADANGAQNTLHDLNLALPEAREQLAIAEKSAAAARHQLAKLQGEKIMRSRVAAAAKMDSAFAECAAAYEQFERLGCELQSFPDLNLAVNGTMSHYEGATGLRRIAGAMPLFFTKLFPGQWTSESKRVPLAQSESEFWNLPAEHHSAKAA